MGASLVGRLRRADPDLRALRRAGRVTLAASLGFYLTRYGLHDRGMATYAVFGAVAMGALAQIPGTPNERARALCAALPVGWVLVVAGTLLADNDVIAAAGMLVVGFVVAFAGVGGARLVGVVIGLQLFYILPCFPPYEPQAMPNRLVGLTLGVLLLAATELTLWPEPVLVSYRRRLAASLSALAGCLAARPSPDAIAAAAAAVEAIKSSALPPAVRPSSAGRADRALSHAGGLVRYTFARAEDLSTMVVSLAGPAPALLDSAAASARESADWLRAEGPLPDGEALPRALEQFRLARLARARGIVDPDALRADSTALAIADGVATTVTVVRVVAGAPVGGGAPWYAGRSGPALYWHRVREHLTPRSVHFQGALRLALALAVGRLLAGAFDLAHGFWVLLAILTVMRASVSQTRAVLWQALVGTFAGAVLAGALLAIVPNPLVFAIALPVVMLVGFTIGPLLGPLTGQAMFALVVSMLFAQLAPTTWRIAEVRLLDVAVGGAVGVLIGLCAWPRGGAGELHRTTADFLTVCAATVRETVATDPIAAQPIGTGTADPVAAARRSGQLADASFALYQSEPKQHLSMVDWQAALVAGHHVVRGAEALHRTTPAGRLEGCADSLQRSAATTADRYVAVASELRGDGVVAVPSTVLPSDEWPAELGPDAYRLADLRVWLDGVDADLARVAPPASQIRASS